jgi:hypothetical protein
MGPYDNLLTSTLTISPFPTWARDRSHTHICVWDAAAAHMNHEDALRKASPGADGRAFLVTGKTKTPWRVEDIRAAIKVCIFIVLHDIMIYMSLQHLASKPIKIVWIDPLFIFVLCHLIEMFMLLRHHFLKIVLPSRKPTMEPRWLGQVVYMQPTTLALTLCEVDIDDSRARKVLG